MIAFYLWTKWRPQEARGSSDVVADVTANMAESQYDTQFSLIQTLGFTQDCPKKRGRGRGSLLSYCIGKYLS